MRLTPGVALAVLLACQHGRAVELIDLQATAPRPARSSAQSSAQSSPQSSTHSSSQVFLRRPVYVPSYFPPEFLPEFLPDSPSDPSPSSVIHFAPYLPADAWSGMPLDAVLSDLPLLAEAPAATREAVPIPVPEPLSVLMLACGLLLMVPGAWAVRWARLDDSESLLQRRLP